MVGTSVTNLKGPGKQENRATRAAKHNILQKLYLREIRGCLQTHQYGQSFELLPQVPERLKFRLSDLFQESVQQFSHVFVGFTKDGYYLLSYSVRMYLIMSPEFSYRLHWWRFIPHHGLKKVAEIQLFGEEDVSSDLLINVCQWPSDDSKLVIYGISQESRGQQSPCYLTIAANPPLCPCPECKETAIENDENVVDAYMNDANDDFSFPHPLCLIHGFVLNLKFSLVPPFPEFNPFVSLQKDGQIVINTGDSIVTLNVTTGVKSQDRVNLLSKSGANNLLKATEEPSLCSHLHSSLAPDGVVSSDNIVNQRQFVNPVSSIEDVDLASGSSRLSQSKCYEYPSLINSSVDGVQLTTSSISSSAVEHFTSPLGRRQGYKVCSKTDGKEDEKLDVELVKAVDGFEAIPDASQVHKVADSSEVLGESCLRTLHGPNPCSKPVFRPDVEVKIDSRTRWQESSTAPTAAPITPKNVEVLTCLQKQSDDYGHSRIIDTGGVTCSSKGFGCKEDKESVKENLFPGCDYNGPQWGKNLSDSSRSDHEEVVIAVDCSKRVSSDVALLSPSLPPPSSPDCSQQLSCVLRLKRVFIPYRDVDSLSIDEDDMNNYDYQGSLPFEAQWPSGTRLMPCPPNALAEVTGPILVVKQAVFDVEQYLHEMAERLCTEDGKRFLAFEDYDIEIVDVLSETSDVIVLAVMIVQATPKSKGSTKAQRNASGIVRKQYETAFKFVWNIDTGRYKVVDIETLKEVDVSKIKQGIQRDWNPGRERCAKLQQNWFLPRSRIREVTMLTNEPVFTGVSLKEITSPFGDVAIVL